MLTDPGPRTIEVVKLLRRRTGLSLWACKCVVDQVPAVILENVPEAVATAAVAELRETGASAHAEVHQ
ncbi:ribosomal protein L7/L12 [Streptomyces sp. NPDC048506]|uniref:ribosomal protein L7/L12 n=1 Tax=Streptomyces sp. NPDC048506 TaxID=3155028 RepID=UPI003445738C